jgi:hypothetical protein
MEGKKKAVSDWCGYGETYAMTPVVVGYSARSCACEMTGDLGGRQLKLPSVFPSLDFYNSFGEAFVSNGDLEWGSHQIGIVELYASSFVPVIPEYF